MQRGNGQIVGNGPVRALMELRLSSGRRKAADCSERWLEANGNAREVQLHGQRTPGGVPVAMWLRRSPALTAGTWPRLDVTWAPETMR